MAKVMAKRLGILQLNFMLLIYQNKIFNSSSESKYATSFIHKVLSIKHRNYS